MDLVPLRYLAPDDARVPALVDAACSRPGGNGLEARLSRVGR